MSFFRSSAVFTASFVMFFANFFRMDLRRLILLLAIFSALVTLANGFYASYRVQRQQLIDSALESNHVYARKLAESVEDLRSNNWPTAPAYWERVLMTRNC